MAHPEQFHGVATKYIHAGQPADSVTGAVMTPISLSTTFLQKSPGHHTGFEYSRSGNPTRNAFEACVAAAEGAKHGFGALIRFLTLSLPPPRLPMRHAETAHRCSLVSVVFAALCAFGSLI